MKFSTVSCYYIHAPLLLDNCGRTETRATRSTFIQCISHFTVLIEYFLSTNATIWKVVVPRALSTIFLSSPQLIIFPFVFVPFAWTVVTYDREQTIPTRHFRRHRLSTCGFVSSLSTFEPFKRISETFTVGWIYNCLLLKLISLCSFCIFSTHRHAYERRTACYDISELPNTCSTIL